MKKFLLLVILGYFASSIMANNPNSDRQVREWIIQENSWLKIGSNGLGVPEFRESNVGKHWIYSQLHQGVPVYGGTIKVNTTLDGTRLHVFNHLKPIHGLLNPPVIPQQPGDIPMYYQSAEGWIPVLRRLIPNKHFEIEEWLLDAQGKPLHHQRLDLLFATDTLVRSKVFNPDPITSAQKAYGQNGLYKNNGGADATELTAERKEVLLTLDFKADSFFAASPYIVIRDLELPNQAVFKSKTPIFDFTRSQVFFRDMSCLYHIETLRKYLAGIGLPLTGMPVIQVDPSAYAGQDQSRFSYSLSEPSLFFGTGGVPDAEDADVIIHEYTHGINFFLAPNSLGGNQRLSLEEANADFMACQYSRGISDFNWRLVFNWDGHNEFWPGRNANSNNTYPKDVSTDPYATSVIWSSMLNDLSEDIGRETSTKLLLQSVYSYSSEITMQDAADLLMEADSLLYGFMHFEQLKKRLEKRGFFVYTGLEPFNRSSLAYRLVNTSGFALHGENLKILIEPMGSLLAVVFDIQGKELGRVKGEEGIVELNGNAFNPGVYLVQLQTAAGATAVFKIIRN